MVSQSPLWSFINGSRPALIPCFLDRSKNAHLDVYIVSRQVKEVIAYINPHIDRLRSIHIELGPDADNQFAALRGLNAAPMLRRLNIECWGVLDPAHLRFTPGVIEPTPSLRHLQLFGIGVTPQLIQLRNLTFVSLDVSRSTLKVSLDLLSNNPLLRVVHLWGQHIGNFSDDDNHLPGSINLPHLEVLMSEMIPLVHLEALSPPRGARVYSGFVRGGSSNRGPGGSYTASFPIPTSFSNLRDLRKLYLVDRGETYVRLEGEDGSVTYCMYSSRPFTPGTFSGVPLEAVTDATYEITPRHQLQAGLSISQPMVSRVICGMTRLQRLELSFCNAEQVEYFLLVLHSANVCKDLKFLVLSHCVDLHQQMRRLVTMSESRKAAGMGLDTVRIVHSDIKLLKDRFKQKDKDVARLKNAVGGLEYVEAEQGRTVWSSLRFDPNIGVA